MSYEIRPISFKKACDFVTAEHRHHKPPRGHKFSLSLHVHGQLVGVCMVGRPVARMLDKRGDTVEVTRMCTNGTPNACSQLYNAARKAARALHYKHLVTYIMADEPGTSLKAANWERKHDTPGRSWNFVCRPREDDHPLGTKHQYAVNL
jgi:hypothetical protein